MTEAARCRFERMTVAWFDGRAHRTDGRLESLMLNLVFWRHQALFHISLQFLGEADD
jgi:hypothetical protein